MARGARLRWRAELDSNGARSQDAVPGGRHACGRRRGRVGSVEALAQALRLAAAAQLGQCLGLDLADALAGEAEALADLVEGARPVVAQAVAQLDDAALAVREAGEDLA